MTQSAPLNLARMLLDQGRPLEARQILAGTISGGADSAPARSLLAMILHQLGDLTGAEQHLRRAVQLAPHDAGAEFALASILNRLGAEEEAEAAARRAIAKGLDEAPAHALLGRILGKQGRLMEAEEAWRRAVRHDPTSPQAQRELSDLIWMRSGDLAAARAELDKAPPTAEITAITVRLLEAAGEQQAAYDLAVARAARDPSLHVLAARSALAIDPGAADRHLKAAPPGHSVPRAKAEIETDLALGHVEEAIKRAETLRTARPSDQYAIALLATAYRLAGDARYKSLYDYDRLVKSYRIEAPQGWNSVEDYLGDLSVALDRIHGPLTHPVGQSLRHGSQTNRNLIDYPDAPIRALFAAIDAPIRQHIAAIGASSDYGIDSAWSVRLNASGYHLNHVHPEGWLSSAFYVRLPAGLKDKEGWIKFGEPGPATNPPLAPEHFVRPQAGMLVLFPSYMWHGTVPFSSEQTRLTCAFDIVRR